MAETRITFHDGCFRVFEGEQEIGKKLISEVSKVDGYKYDNFSYDEIAVLIEFSDGTSCELIESESAFIDAMTTMEKELLGFDSKWFATIAHPAFAKNLTTIWKAVG